MKAFKYAAPTTEKDACLLLGENSLPLAGGTNLINLMKERVVEPDVVVGLKSIPDLAKISRTDDGGLQIGANVTLTAILKHSAVIHGYPALHQALSGLATPQIRNMSTLGGNLCARPACWYFASGHFSCAKSGGTDCPAKQGENEFHAVFDTDGPCVMVHPSSAAPALLALGAKVGIASPQGRRDTDLEKFFASPDADVHRENVLQPNEIVTHVLLGKPNAKSGSYAVRQKASHDWPVSEAAAALKLDAGGICTEARVFIGAVAPTPRRASGAERALLGKRITAASAEKAAAAAVEGAKPLSQNTYKVTTIQAAVKRAVLLAGTGKWN